MADGLQHGQTSVPGLIARDDVSSPRQARHGRERSSIPLLRTKFYEEFSETALRDIPQKRGVRVIRS